MGNLMDYMDWRGDVPFSGSPFNEIDNIILAMTAFVDLSGIVGPGFDLPLRFTEAMAKFETLPDEKKYLGVLIPQSILDISRKAATCPRFSELKVCGFVNRVDEREQMQFAALTLILPDDTFYITFRGTDDTIIGWKEDFFISFKTPIPAHLQAEEYLNKAAESLSGKIRVGGHSKGGNLAMWAASHCKKEVQDRIIRVYNNDGPGFLPEVLAEPSFSAVADRIITYLPQSSIVGAILERPPVYKIIKSNVSGILQHDPLSWEVLGNRFIYLDKRSKFGEHVEEAMRKWIYSMSVTERERFTELIYAIITSTGAKTLTELNGAKVKNFNMMMKAIRVLDSDSRAMMYRVIRGLFGKIKDDENHNCDENVRLQAGDDKNTPIKALASVTASHYGSKHIRKGDEDKPQIMATEKELIIRFFIPDGEDQSRREHHVDG